MSDLLGGYPANATACSGVRGRYRLYREDSNKYIGETDLKKYIDYLIFIVYTNYPAKMTLPKKTELILGVAPPTHATPSGIQRPRF